MDEETRLAKLMSPGSVLWCVLWDFVLLTFLSGFVFCLGFYFGQAYQANLTVLSPWAW